MAFDVIANINLLNFKYLTTMKSLFFILLFLTALVAQGAKQKGFITTWKTNTPNENIRIPINGGYQYHYQVDWGDGTTSTETGSAIHQYAQAGTYQVTITGEFHAIMTGKRMGSYTPQLQSIDQWGDIVWKTMKYAFMDCPNLVLKATDAPNLSQVTDIAYMFHHVKNFDADMSNWDVSRVKNMSYMFCGTPFNQNIGSWNVENVTDMSGMFKDATSFNQDIGNWNTQNVTDMSKMFYKAQAFNQNISHWDTQNVTTMHKMFHRATSFNQDISRWNTQSVTNMSLMFWKAIEFNQNIGDWDTQNVTNMARMLYKAESFKQNLTTWKVENVIECSDFDSGSALTMDDLPTFINCKSE